MDLRSKVAERACQEEVERMKGDRFAVAVQSQAGGKIP